MGYMILNGDFGSKIPEESLPKYNDPDFRSRSSNQPLLGGDHVVPGGGGGRLVRGFMKSSTGVKPMIRFQFMYNPRQVNSAYDINESMIGPELLGYEDQPAEEQVNNLVGGASISFALLLDRTVEMATTVPKKNNSNATGPGRIGVLHDIAVFERLVGSLDANQIVSRPIEVHFTNYGKRSPLNFKGYITACHISFGGTDGLFSHHMIPTRCVIDVTMRKMFVPSATGPPTTSDGVTTTTNSDGTTTQSATPGPGEVVHRKPDGTLEVMTAEEFREWQEQHK